jgi:predicted nucleotidyltransferase
MAPGRNPWGFSRSIEEMDILSALQRIEEVQNLKLLFAIESGSRAYEFHSVNSDYDIRGIYVYPFKRYLNLDKPEEQLSEMVGDHDFVLWDLRKALLLLSESNPSLLDWLSSPIVYREEPGFRDSLIELAKEYYSPEKYFNANFGLAKKHYLRYIEECRQVESKVYLYTLRALAACRYVLRESFAPPISRDFQDEYPNHKVIIEKLISNKKAGEETQLRDYDSRLDDLIRNELNELEKERHSFTPVKRDLASATKFFLDHVLKA